MTVKYFLLIRHGKTQGNIERRYLGDPDEPLSEEGIREAERLAGDHLLPPVDLVLSGPAMRCRQTAKILFPGTEPEICPLSEIDFGIFKGKNADDLIDNKEYRQWLETGCTSDIPGGESVSAFKKRCCEVFKQIAEQNNAQTAALIVHGGNIMAIMENFAIPRRDFYEYHIPNCGFLLRRYEGGMLYVELRSGV